MEVLNREEIKKLLGQRGLGPCISLYMPTQKGREKARENAIRFKNLVTEAEKKLENFDLNNQDLQQLLEPAKKLIDDSYFWSKQSDGFAYFLAPDLSRFYRLPVEFEELSVVRDSFHIKPLFSLLASDGQFYVLALSQKDARLLRGTSLMIEEIDISDVIQKFEEKFATELPEQFLQFHTRAPATGDVRSAIYHGHGGEIDSYQKEKLLKYFRFIDRELQEKFDQPAAPIVLACVDNLFSTYREASKYPLLFEKGIKGNPEHMSAQELHQKAWEIVRPYFEQKQEEAKALYRELSGTGKTSNDLTDIVPASFHGRISDIFVTPGVQQWGNYDPETEMVQLSEAPLTGNEDLIDLAAVETFMHNGNVYAINSEQMPDQSPVCAVYRW